MRKSTSVIFFVLSLELSLVSVNQLVAVVADYVEAVNRNEYQNGQNDGAGGGSQSNALSLCYSSLLLHEQEEPNDIENTAGYATEQERGDEAHDLLCANLFSHFVLLLSHLVPHVEGINAAGNDVEQQRLDPVKLLHK